MEISIQVLFKYFLLRLFIMGYNEKEDLVKGDIIMRFNIDFEQILTVIFFIILITMQIALNKIIVLLKGIDTRLKQINNTSRIDREG